MARGERTPETQRTRHELKGRDPPAIDEWYRLRRTADEQRDQICREYYPESDIDRAYPTRGRVAVRLYARGSKMRVRDSHASRLGRVGPDCAKHLVVHW